MPFFHVSGDVWRDILTLHCPVAVLKCLHSSSAAPIKDCCDTQTLVSCFPGERTSQCSPSTGRTKSLLLSASQLGTALLLVCINLGGEGVFRVCPRPSDSQMETETPHCAMPPWEWELGMGQEKGAGKLQGAATSQENILGWKRFLGSTSPSCARALSATSRCSLGHLLGWALLEAGRAKPEVVPGPASFPQGSSAVHRLLLPFASGFPAVLVGGSRESSPWAGTEPGMLQVCRAVCDGSGMAAALCRELEPWLRAFVRHPLPFAVGDV